MATIRVKPVVRVESITVSPAPGSNHLTSGELRISNQRLELVCLEDGTLHQQFPIEVEISPMTDVEIGYQRAPLPWLKVQRIDAQRLLQDFSGSELQELSVDELEDGILVILTVYLVKSDNDNHNQTCFPRPGQFPHLFALLIGIDDYIGFQLSGAASAAKATKEFLQACLGVPEDHIWILLDGQATRGAIVGAFEAIESDERIGKENPILILFAGHVDQLPLSSSGLGDNKGNVHRLFPHDHEDTGPISGYKIGDLIDDIARAKGDNIVLILDSIVTNDRGEDPRGHITERLDNETDIFLHHDQRTHVTLAAYSGQVFSRGHNVHGQFTSGLLRVLKSHSGDSLTYAQILERVERVDKQNYRCIGIRQRRILFSVRLLAGSQVRYHAKLCNDGTYVLGAGSAHGISPGAEFTLYDDRGECLGVAVPVLDGIEDFQTSVTTSTPLTSVSYAKLTRIGEMPVYLAPGRSFSAVLKNTLQRVTGLGINSPRFRLVDEATEAKVHVEMENDRVVFTILDGRMQVFRHPGSSSYVALNDLIYILHRIMHYCWYLHLTNSPPGLDHSHVAVYFYRPDSESGSASGGTDSSQVSVKSWFSQKDPTPVIDFAPDPGAKYVVEIKNNTPRDLYLNAFWFGFGLRASPFYIQSSAGKLEAPFKQNEAFTIDHFGLDSDDPIQFSSYLFENPAKDIYTIYLKLFFSTQPIDLTDITQSPFRSSFWDMDAISSKDDTGEEQDDDTWFTVMIPLVLRRPQEAEE